ncbi:MAG: response regulator [Promethearchaeota archaeon]|jgi:DNA-binding response OmpR family regulator
MEKGHTMIDFLIIEDDFSTVDLLKMFIITSGYTCKHAGSVKKGLEILNNYTPSIILLDLLLPDKKGYEIIPIIKSNLLFKDVLIYFLTAIPTPEALELMEKYGAHGIILKPFNIDEIEALFNIIEKK